VEELQPVIIRAPAEAYAPVRQALPLADLDVDDHDAAPLAPDPERPVALLRPTSHPPKGRA
jgi:hypothetical protein